MEQEETNNERIIRKVWERKAKDYKQKLVTIPSESEIKTGDLVEIKKLK